MLTRREHEEIAPDNPLLHLGVGARGEQAMDDAADGTLIMSFSVGVVAGDELVHRWAGRYRSAMEPLRSATTGPPASQEPYSAFMQKIVRRAEALPRR